MGDISQGMESICQDIVNSFAERKKLLKDVWEETESIRDGARKFVGDCKREHKEMARNLKESLLKGRDDLTKNVGLLRKDFQNDQKAVRLDLEEAGKNWKEMQKVKYEKRHNKP